MPTLKSLRGAIGSYGRVGANGIVEVDEAQARKLLATKRFVVATAKDIETAKARLHQTLTGEAKAIADAREAEEAAAAKAKEEAEAQAAKKSGK